MTYPDTTAVIPALSEASIERALISSRGDLFVAASQLGHLSPIRLDRLIRCSERLRNLYTEIGTVPADDYHTKSLDQITKDVERRLALYRSDGLDTLHSLAMMDHGDNSAMAQVRLAAAARLVGGTPENQSAGGSMDQTLAILNDEYQKSAPRIKRVRERVIEFEDEKVISDQ